MFVKNYGQIAKPLYRLANKYCAFKWKDECEQAIETLRICLVSSPILTYPKVGETILDTDNSDHASGAILLHVQKGHERVFACYGKTMNKQ